MQWRARAATWEEKQVAGVVARACRNVGGEGGGLGKGVVVVVGGGTRLGSARDPQREGTRARGSAECVSSE